MCREGFQSRRHVSHINCSVANSEESRSRCQRVDYVPRVRSEEHLGATLFGYASQQPAEQALVIGVEMRVGLVQPTIDGEKR